MSVGGIVEKEVCETKQRTSVGEQQGVERGDEKEKQSERRTKTVRIEVLDTEMREREKCKEKETGRKSSGLRCRTGSESCRSVLVELGTKGRLSPSRGRIAAEEGIPNEQSLRSCCRGKE